MVDWLTGKKWRVILTGVLITILPLASLAFFVRWTVLRTMNELVIRHGETIAKISAGDIEGKIRGDIQSATMFATRLVLKNAIRHRDPREMTRHLKIFIGNSPSIERVFIASQDGVLLTDYPSDPRVAGKNFSGRDWFQGAMKRRAPYVSDFYQRMAEPKRYLFSIAVPFKRDDGAILAVLVLQPNENYLKDAIRPSEKGNPHIYVVDRHGAKVSDTEAATDNIVDLSRVPLVRNVLKGESGSGRMIDIHGKDPVFAAYHPVKEWGWGVVVERSLDEVYEPTRKVALGLYIFTGIMLLLAVLMGYRWAKELDNSRRIARDLKEKEILEKAYNDFLVLLNRQWQDPEELCNASLGKFHEHAHAAAGVFHVHDEGGLTPRGSFSVPLPVRPDGLSAECLRLREVIGIHGIPPDSPLRIETGMGVVAPREIVAVPLIFKDEPMGVLELACVHGFSEADLLIVKRIAPQLAIGINTVRNTLALRKLTEKLTYSNEELQAMNEELHAQQEEISEANRKLTEISRTKSDFLANMSHELRTPLNSVIGFSEVLQDETFGPLDEKQREYVGHILTSGRHLLSLINDILDLSKVETGRMELERSRFPLREALDAAMTLLKEKALKNSLELSLEVDPDADVMIDADQRKLKQILFNLLSNAVKFTPAGGSVRVLARWVPGPGIAGMRVGAGPLAGIGGGEEAPGWIEISVTDTGIGIKADDLPKLFKEFTQLESPYTKEYEGTGLGLALTKKLVELHGGTIKVTSEIDKGSRFYFTLPLGTVQDARPDTSPADGRHGKRPGRQRLQRPEGERRKTGDRSGTGGSPRPDRPGPDDARDERVRGGRTTGRRGAYESGADHRHDGHAPLRLRQGETPSSGRLARRGKGGPLHGGVHRYGGESRKEVRNGRDAEKSACRGGQRKQPVADDGYPPAPRI